MRSSFYVRAMGDPDCQEPYAPNIFELGGTQSLLAQSFVRQNEACDACSVIRLPLSLAGCTTLRAALPQFASYLSILPSHYEKHGHFVPTLKVGGGVILHQNFETEGAPSKDAVEMCRSVFVCRGLCVTGLVVVLVGLVAFVWLHMVALSGVVACAIFLNRIQSQHGQNSF